MFQKISYGFSITKKRRRMEFYNHGQRHSHRIYYFWLMEIKRTKGISSREAARRIQITIEYLKTFNIRQKDIAQKISYTSLSKAKNFENYPQTIIENKSRQDLLSELFDAYNITFNDKEDTVQPLLSKPVIEKCRREISFYVIYYYALAKGIVGKGIVSIIDRNKAKIEFLDPNFTLSVWEGSFEVIESYTFMNVIKQGDSTPVKAMYSLFSGTIKYGRPVLLGTYCSIKRDGYPTAGEVVLENVGAWEIALEKMQSPTDTRIVTFLEKKNFTVPCHTPVDLDDLPVVE